MTLESIINGALLSVMPTLYRSGTYHTATRVEQPNGDVTESFTDTPCKVQCDVSAERSTLAIFAGRLARTAGFGVRSFF